MLPLTLMHMPCGIRNFKLAKKKTFFLHIIIIEYNYFKTKNTGWSIFSSICLFFVPCDTKGKYIRPIGIDLRESATLKTSFVFNLNKGLRYYFQPSICEKKIVYKLNGFIMLVCIICAYNRRVYTCSFVPLNFSSVHKRKYSPLKT